MQALTISEFTGARKEFAKTDTGLVQSCLDEARLRVNAEVWGDLTKIGQSWLAAHLIATSPMGQQARKQNAEEKTTYLVEFERLELIVSCGRGRLT